MRHAVCVCVSVYVYLCGCFVFVCMRVCVYVCASGRFVFRDVYHVMMIVQKAFDYGWRTMLLLLLHIG